MPADRNDFMLKTLTPRYWPTWIALGLLRLGTLLPLRGQLAVGRWLGRRLHRFMHRRRRIAATNLRLCFPDLDEPARRRLLLAHFESLGMGFMETALSWWGGADRLRRLVRVEGMEHLEAAQARGRGVLIVAAHFTTLEIGARLLALTVPLHPMYRPHNNPLFERIQGRARTRQSAGAIRRDDIRATLRALKANRAVWYAPDQDFGPRQSVFVPFMGINAATLTATGRLAGMSGAAVVPMTQERLADGSGYRVILEPALEDLPSGDDEADARRQNAVFERWIHERPADYLWVHRRFKTRPEGEEGLYEPR